jgi:hypothetical protein
LHHQAQVSIEAPKLCDLPVCQTEQLNPWYGYLAMSFSGRREGGKLLHAHAG